MRRFALAALSGALMLSACSDQSLQPPTAPPAGGQPAFDKGVACGTPAFPLSDAQQRVRDLYPNGALENNALAKVFDISKRWSQCKVADPQAKVGTFVQNLLKDFRAGVLNSYTTSPTTVERVGALINLMYSGVGLANTRNDGVGFFQPGTQLLVRADGNKVGAIVCATCFSEPTLISVTRLPDTPPQLVTDGRDQFAPFWDVNASNASNTHVMTGFGITGACVEDAVLAQIEANDGDPQVGHNPFNADPQFFEILSAASPSEYASLGLACTTQANPPTSSFRNGGGTLGDLALGAWQAASQSVSSAAQWVFLPRPLRAATLLTPTGVAGRTSSYSPFGVVDAFSCSECSE
jgi:hypothetical protein